MFQTEFFQNTRILVIGDVMLDQYWHGNTHRISPEAPVPVLKVSDKEQRAGGAANVALNASSLGAQTTLLSVVGCDQAATSLKQLLEQKGIVCEFHQLNDYPTTTKLRIMAQHQQLIRCDDESIPHNIQPVLMQKCAQLLPSIDVVVLSDYAKGVLEHASELIDLCKEHNKPVIVDPKRSFEHYRGATLLTPNLLEFEQATQHLKNQDNALCMQHCLESYQFDAILLTQGAQGMSLLAKGQNQLYHIPSEAKEVFDITGAGDTVIGVFAVMMAKGFTLEQCTYYANVAAGLSVSKLGTAQVSCDELNRAIRVHEANSSLSIQDVKSLVAASKSQGQRVVFTNGCFDVLHVGHIDYLTKAKALGDILVVGLNSDASVRRLKGPSRPINTLENRSKTLQALRMVDLVIPFDEDTPLTLIEELLPDVLTKGGDYTIDNIVGADVVQRTGGKVVVLPFIDGLSTTKTLEKLAEASI